MQEKHIYTHLKSLTEELEYYMLDKNFENVNLAMLVALY